MIWGNQLNTNICGKYFSLTRCFCSSLNHGTLSAAFYIIICGNINKTITKRSLLRIRIRIRPCRLFASAHKMLSVFRYIHNFQVWCSYISWASAWDFGTYHIGDQLRLSRAYADSGASNSSPFTSYRRAKRLYIWSNCMLNCDPDNFSAIKGRHFPNIWTMLLQNNKFGLRNRSALAVNCWVIMHCLEVSCKGDQITSAKCEWFICLQLVDSWSNYY